MKKLLAIIAIWYPTVLGILFPFLLSLRLSALIETTDEANLEKLTRLFTYTFYAVFPEIPLVIFWAIKKRWLNILLTLISICLFFLFVFIGLKLTGSEF